LLRPYFSLQRSPLPNVFHEGFEAYLAPMTVTSPFRDLFSLLPSLKRRILGSTLLRILSRSRDRPFHVPPLFLPGHFLFMSKKSMIRPEDRTRFRRRSRNVRRFPPSSLIPSGFYARGRLRCDCLYLLSEGCPLACSILIVFFSSRLARAGPHCDTVFSAAIASLCNTAPLAFPP